MGPRGLHLEIADVHCGMLQSATWSSRCMCCYCWRLLWVRPPSPSLAPFCSERQMFTLHPFCKQGSGGMERVRHLCRRVPTVAKHRGLDPTRGVRLNLLEDQGFLVFWLAAPPRVWNVHFPFYEIYKKSGQIFWAESHSWDAYHLAWNHFHSSSKARCWRAKEQATGPSKE